MGVGPAEWGGAVGSPPVLPLVPAGVLRSRARSLESYEGPECRDYARQAEVGKISDDAVDILVRFRRLLHEEVAILAHDHPAKGIPRKLRAVRFAGVDAASPQSAIEISANAAG